MAKFQSQNPVDAIGAIQIRSTNIYLQILNTFRLITDLQASALDTAHNIFPAIKHTTKLHCVQKKESSVYILIIPANSVRF